MSRKQHGRKKVIRPFRHSGWRSSKWARKEFQALVDDESTDSIPRHHWPSKAHVYWPQLFPSPSTTYPSGETLARQARINVVEWDEINSAKHINWLISQVDGCRLHLGGAAARDVVEWSILKAYDTHVEGRGRTFESWVRLISYRDLIHALDAKRRELDHYKHTDRLLRYSDERGERILYFRRPPITEYPVRHLYEDPDDMLINSRNEGFERHTLTSWSVCGSARACLLNPNTICMRRPADHEFGYGILCVECHSKLHLVDNSGYRKPTPIHELPFRHEKTNHIRNVGAKTGAGTDS